MKKKLGATSSIVLVGFVLLFGGLIIPGFVPESNSSHDIVGNTCTERTGSANSAPVNQLVHADSDDPIEGVIDPVTVEQAGYFSSGNLTGRTDTGVDSAVNLTIDEENEWVGSRAEIDVYNLERLYTANGTFDDGIPGKNQNPTPATTDFYPYGWAANSGEAGEGTDENQFASYEPQSDPYVTVENQAVEGGLWQDYYDHYTGTYVVWRQIVQNAPSTTDFVVSFDYLYFSGPLYRPGGDDPGGDAWVIVAVGGTVVWNQSLLSLGNRNTWYNTGDISLSDLSVGDYFVFSIGLYIADGMRLYSDRDYDNDGVNDGTGNAASIIVHFDDVTLIGSSPPSFESVELQFKAGTFTTDITGANGIGNASITNANSWTTDLLGIEILSNTSVRVEYRTRLLSHRFINSTWSTNALATGVAFAAAPDESPEMTLYAYVGVVDPYEDFFVNIIHPTDWANGTVLNPFLTDVTSGTTSSDGMLTIPTDLLSVLGWWRISLDSPNYLQGKDIELLDSTTWRKTTTLRPDNTTRATVEIGTGDSSPVISSAVNITWYQPDDTVWAEQQASNVTGNIVSTDLLNLGPLNTSAGEWTLSILWTNGTEIAYGTMAFDFYRTASLEPVFSSLSVDFGEVVSNFLRYRDTETGTDLLEDEAELLANWSTTTVSFSPNLVRNWWEADFDTTIVGGGSFLVVVNASRPYYDNVTTAFVIESTYVTCLTIISPGEETIERDFNKTFEVAFNYTRENGSGISGATIDISYTSPKQGLNWDPVQDYGNGTYSFTLAANMSGTYTVTIDASKESYSPSGDSLTVVINEIETQILSQNGTIGTVRFGSPFNFALRYTNGSGYGIPGASVSIVSIEPFSSLPPTTVYDLGDGCYTIALDFEDAGVYTIVFEANLTNYEPQFLTFTIVVREIPTTLRAVESSRTLAVDLSYSLVLVMEDDLGFGLAGATLEVVSRPPEVFVSSFEDLGDGTYNVTLSADAVGAYDLLIRARLLNYQNSTETFTLLVTLIPTDVRIAGGISSLSVDYAEQNEIIIIYRRVDLNQNITDAVIEVSTGASGATIAAVYQSNGYYVIRFASHQLIPWQLSVTANKSDYRLATTSLLIQTDRIDTVLVGANPAGELTILRSYQLPFSYLFQSNESGIPFSTLTPTGEAASWIEGIEASPGEYMLNLTPEELGPHVITLSFEREGFETRQFRLTFTVITAPMEVVFVQGLSGYEGAPSDLVVRVQEVGTETPVTGATVAYRVFDAQGIGNTPTPMNEVEPGVYSAQLIMPDSQGSYTVKILVEADNYELEGSAIASLSPQTEFGALVMRTVSENILLIVGLVSVAVGLVTRSLYRRRRIQENLEALAVKKRFDDARNILGVIVLHKASGLPLYSKMLRAGIEEGVISAFITAIRSFRLEFGLESEGVEEGKILPISDVMRIVSTKNLVCAFITVDSPSQQQRGRMLDFARKVGEVFDETFSDTPTEVMDSDTTAAFDSLLQEVMDVALLRRYEVREDVEISHTDKCVEQGLAEFKGSEFLLDQLADAIAKCGLEEGRAYVAILEAMNNGVLTPTSEQNYTRVSEAERFLEDVESPPENGHDSSDAP